MYLTTKEKKRIYRMEIKRIHSSIQNFIQLKNANNKNHTNARITNESN